MTHAVSLTHDRYDHMSPTAMGLAALLHAAVFAALFLISPLKPVDTTPDAIEITLDAPPPPVETPVETPAEAVPAPPPAPPAAAAAPPPAATPAPTPAAPPIRLGLAPVGPSQDQKLPPGTAQPEAPKPPTPEPKAAQPEPPPPPVQEAQPEPRPEPPPEPRPEQQQATTTPPPPPPPPPPSQTLESALPPVDAPPPPVTAREIPSPAAPPPPAPRAPPPTQARVQPAPPPPPVRAPQNPALHSSPLSTAPQQRTPAEQQQAARQAPAFVNPAQSYGTKRIEDQYIWQVAQKLSAHQQFVRNASTESGTVVLRLVIARDGRLVDVGLSRSSGIASLDQASINMVRAASPYPPMPEELGAQHTFTLPLYFKRSS